MRSKMFIGILAGLSIILSAISICLDMSEVVVSDVSLVLGFVGILATFIVVNNAIQVWSIEKKVDRYGNLLTDLINLKLKLLYATKRNILSFVYREIRTIESSNKNKNIDLAFLFLLDIIPLLEELYGKNGDNIDEDGDSLNTILQCFQLLLKYDTQDEITIKSLTTCLKRMNQYLPNSYKNINFIQEIKQELSNKIKKYE